MDVTSLRIAGLCGVIDIGNITVQECGRILPGAGASLFVIDPHLILAMDEYFACVYVIDSIDPDSAAAGVVPHVAGKTTSVAGIFMLGFVRRMFAAAAPARGVAVGPINGLFMANET